MPDNREQQAEALIAKMKAARGYMYPEWEFAARQDPPGGAPTFHRGLGALMEVVGPAPR
ncbi:MAG TPA: hypothetical protein VGB86_10525 [Methylomirabilota bacterium]|jgi:hypothetical protein